MGDISSFDNYRKKQGAKFSDVFGNSMSALISRGIYRDSVPPGPCLPDSPKNVSAMSTKDLGDLYDTFLQWFTYLTNEEIQYSIAVQQRDEWLNFTEAQILKEDVLKGVPKTQQAKMMAALEIYVDAKTDLMEQAAILDGIRLAKNRVKENMKQLSRHITMRDLEVQFHNRGQNINSPRYNDDT